MLANSQKAFRDELERVLHSHIDAEPHPVVAELFSDRTNRDLLKHVSLEAYQITKHFVDYIEHLYFYCPLEKYKTPLLINLFEESTGKISRTKNHIHLMQDFLRAQGLHEEQWDNIIANPETQELIDYRKTACRNPDMYHIGAAAVMIASEGQNLEEKAAEARSSLLEKRFNLSENDTLFFSVHAKEDVGHTQQGLSLVSEFCTTRKMKEEALEAVDHTCKLFWNMYEGIWTKHLDGQGVTLKAS